jgi:hypothetical protein
VTSEISPKTVSYANIIQQFIVQQYILKLKEVKYLSSFSLFILVFGGTLAQAREVQEVLDLYILAW